jgi:aldehyde:ferredoxin oxidoreductase
VKRILTHPNLCSGCRACEIACVTQHEGHFGASTTRIHVTKIEPLGLDYQVCRLGTTKLVRALNDIGGLPTRHFQSGRFEGADAVSGEAIEALYKVKGKACFACTVPCSRFLVVDDARFPGLRLEGPEYEPLAGFSARVGNSDLALAIKCVDLSNRYGLDAITLSEVIAWAIECYQRGLLTRQETGGLDLAWGNGAAILALVHQVAQRQGFGDLLADGVVRAAERLGVGAELAMHSKGLEVFKAYGLGNAVASRGRARAWWSSTFPVRYRPAHPRQIPAAQVDQAQHIGLKVSVLWPVLERVSKLIHKVAKLLMALYNCFQHGLSGSFGLFSQLNPRQHKNP